MAGYWNNEGASPTKVTWKNPQVVPENKRQSGGWYYNPASGYVEKWWAQGTGPGQAGTSTQSQPMPAQVIADPVEQALQNVKNVVMEAMKPQEAAEKKYSEYKTKNPFSFDEQMARASAQERYNPYYEAELKDYTKGVEYQRNRSTADEERLRTELNTQTEKYVGRAKRQIDEALSSSAEGFAGAGLFMSGRRIAAGGDIEIKGNEQIGDTQHQAELQKQESLLRQERTGQDLDLQSGTFNRRLGAEKETNILTDVEKQRQEALRKNELAAIEYAGYPGNSSISLRNQLLGLS